MKTIIFLAALLAFTGCTTSKMSLHYTPFIKAQQQWPTQPFSSVEKVDDFPIYHAPPPKPYTILGQIDTIDNNNHRLVRVGRKYHGDAIVIISAKNGVRRYYLPPGGSGHMQADGAGSTPSYRKQYTARTGILIKFKSPLQARLDAINAFLAKAQANPGGWSVKDARGRTNFITRKQVSERVAELQKEKEALEATTPKSSDPSKQ